MTIVNIRGTNGSGKSTIIRTIMKMAGRASPLYGVLGPRKPEAYSLAFDDIADPVHVLGSYHVTSGGCDQIQPYDLILELLPKYADRGHVLFEGVLVSSSYGRVGRMMETYGPQRAVMAFLDTSLEACIKNVETRRKAKGDDRPLNPHNLTTKWHQIYSGKEKIRAEGKVGVIGISIKDGVSKVMELLRS